MPSFSKRSLARLNTCHPSLISIMLEVVKVYDCTILTGFRNELDQNAAYHSGKSSLLWPRSKHNATPSLAVDVAPWVRNTIPWPNVTDWSDRGQRLVYSKNLAQFYYLAGVIKGVAHDQGVKIRFGGDWDMDNDLLDNKFNDLVHFEVKNNFSRV